MQKRNARWSEEALDETPRGPSRTQLAAGDKDGGVADSAEVNSKQDGNGCTGMPRCPIPANMFKSPQTYPNSVTAATLPYPFSIPFTVIIVV